jgi:hypothetical protein
MRKSFVVYIQIVVIIVSVSGCMFWSSDENGNYYVRVNNNTDNVIVVYYNINHAAYDGTINDYHWYSNANISISAGEHEIIEVQDEFYDADVRIDYKGTIKRYDIDPDFFGWDEIDVNISDFALGV